MKILMAPEYFYPFDLGGSEWSTYYLSKELIKKGISVTIITPNYGSKTNEIYKGIKIKRFPFYKKIESKKQISPFWHTNFIWILISSFYLLKTVISEKADVVHLQGKYFAPAGYLVKLITGKPVILTARDYQLICNYGICLWNSDKKCKIYDYFKNDFTKYMKTYFSKPSLLNYLTDIIFATRGRIVTNTLSFFAKKLDLIICVSNSQKNIYTKNGFSKVKTIYNMHDFKITNDLKIKSQLIYAGRLTYGKGVETILDAAQIIAQTFPKINIILVGDGYLKKKVISVSRKNKNLKYVGHLEHKNLISQIKVSLGVIVPSIWKEPFGRIALEALSTQTPVIASNKGGLPEIVAERWGTIIEPDKEGLIKGVNNLIKKNKIYRANIKKDMNMIVVKFQNIPLKEHIKLYKELI